MPTLSAIDRAADAEAGMKAPEDLGAGDWGRRPAITQTQRRNWQHVVPFFAYPESVRSIIYTTDAVEMSAARRRHFQIALSPGLSGRTRSNG
ncbi:transposase [Aminobacter anthyllidis]|uniref:Transposase n=1 Tax=Aminobacter anthyllidis TaxID=1035067 RepID=A0A9X1AGZ7_9HYPH|nr:transposase [Aminobacter anthyllidis]